MRTLTILAILMTALATQANEKFFGEDNKEITKLQAIRKLIENEQANILRCNLVMLTDKATLKNRPKGIK